MRIKSLAQGHYCRCQQIRTGDLTIESVVCAQHVKHVKNVFVQVGVVCQFSSCIRTALCTTLHKLKTWTKTVLTCFTKIVAEQPIPRQMNMLSSIDNNFMIFLFVFERFRIESRFPFFYFFFVYFLLTLYIPAQ